jgi:hypothetical protein
MTQGPVSAQLILMKWLGHGRAEKAINNISKKKKEKVISHY